MTYTPRTHKYPKVRKPRPKIRKSYDYFQIKDFIEKKYNLDMDDRSNRENSFWFWLIDRGDIHNGCEETISPKEDLEVYLNLNPKIKEILLVLQKEFGDYIDVWIEW